MTATELGINLTKVVSVGARILAFIGAAATRAWLSRLRCESPQTNVLVQLALCAEVLGAGANHDAAMVGEASCDPDILGNKRSRDEYPFKSTKEGGNNYHGMKAQVMCVPSRENSSQGGQLNDFYTRELKQVNGAAFFVIPVPW